jgi:hypothetical protein
MTYFQQLTRYQVANNIYHQVENKVWDKSRDQVAHRVWKQVHEQTTGQVLRIIGNLILSRESKEI